MNTAITSISVTVCDTGVILFSTYIPLWDTLALPAGRPVDLEDLGHVGRQAGAVRHQHAQLFNLGRQCVEASS